MHGDVFNGGVLEEEPTTTDILTAKECGKLSSLLVISTAKDEFQRSLHNSDILNLNLTEGKCSPDGDGNGAVANETCNDDRTSV